MSMQARMIRDAQGNIVIHMQGDLNYEHSIPLRQELQKIIKDHPNARVTVDLSGIDFVGSSGICHFVETLKLIKDNNQKAIALGNVRPEFIKVFKLYGLDEAEHIAAHFDFDNDETRDLNQRFGARKQTFEN